jgi:hypothetical protein
MKKVFVILVVTVLLTYVILPYVQWWRLECAAISNDHDVLSALIDLSAVHGAIKRRLNKNFPEANSKPSDAFVAWIQAGLLRLGNNDIKQLVTIEWVRQQLLSKVKHGDYMCAFQHVSYAFFNKPNEFLVRIGELQHDPVHIRLKLTAKGWRVTMVYN